MNFTQQSCETFISLLASKAPVPGGGGASAYVGAVGTALGNMVGSLTLGKKKYAEVQEDIIRLKEQAVALQTDLIGLVAKDAEVFEPLARAYGMPRETEAEKAEKEQVMEAALREACTVPFRIMEKCCEAIELHREFAEKGTAIAISDVGVGVVFCKAALQGASLNVFINTKAMTNRPCADEINRKAAGMLEYYLPLADSIYTAVAARLR
jgi:formiminotetrahydrofolate cyclodeaminase